MNRRAVSRRILGAVIAFFLLTSFAFARTITDDYWDDRFFVSGLADNEGDGAVVVFEGDLIVGGSFEHVDGISARNIARWDGFGWSAMGGGLDSTVFDLVIYSGDLIAGVKYDDDDGAANTVVRWTGTTWAPLGSMVDGTVNAMTVYDGDLIVAGEFNIAGGKPAPLLARWDGVEWWPMVAEWSSDGWFPVMVEALAVYDGDLIVGGSFDTLDGLAAHAVVRYNPTDGWDSLAGGFPGDGFNVSPQVEALTVYNGKLIAGGDFIQAEGSPGDYISAWDGATWSPLGTGVSGTVRSLAVFDDLLITDRMYSWDGFDWAYDMTYLDGRVADFALSGSELVAVGSFSTAEDIVVNGVASWNGATWSRISARDGLGISINGHSTDNSIDALCEFQGNLIASGGFHAAGLTPVDNIAAWNGSEWSPLGAASDSGNIGALTVYGPNLIAGGNFTAIGGVPANRLAAWNGSNWSPLGAGVDTVYDEFSYESARVNALVTYGGDLIAGGRFDLAGGSPASNIARWDGSAWHPLGDGVNGSVRALAVHFGALIAGGDFSEAGGAPANYIARWNGSSWEALGSGTNGSVVTLVVYHDFLIVGGGFTHVGAQEVNGLVRWVPGTWYTIGTRPQPIYIEALTVCGDNLYAGGGVNEEPYGCYLASWSDNSGSWQPLGSGLIGDDVQALKCLDSVLYVGGEFLQAGGNPSVCFAAWHRQSCCRDPLTGNVDSDPDDYADISDLVYLIDYMFTGGPPPACDAEADLVQDNTLDISDLIYMIDYMFRGGPAPPACP